MPESSLSPEQKPALLPGAMDIRERNALLRALTVEQCNDLKDARVVTLERGDELPAPAAGLVFFPLSAVCSVLVPSDTAPIEGAVVGNEGIVPPCIANHVEQSEERVVVSVEGQALQVPLASFRRAVDTSGRFRRALGVFSQSLLSQAMHVSACGRRHGVTRQTARWLLATRDRVTSDDIAVTHALVAQMLGVRRASVTVAAEVLRDLGAIEYTRGRVRVVSAERLRAASCGCYDALRRCRDDVLLV